MIEKPTDIWWCIWYLMCLFKSRNSNFCTSVFQEKTVNFGKAVRPQWGLLEIDRILAIGHESSQGRVTTAVDGIYFFGISLRRGTASNQQLRYGLLSRMHQFGGSLFAFEIVVNQGGKSCFSMCVTQQRTSFDWSHGQHSLGFVREYVHKGMFAFTHSKAWESN